MPPHAREEMFQLLVERVRDYAIFMLDPAGIVMSWNRGAQRIKGYAAAEIVGHHFSRFYPEEALRAGWPQTELKLAAAEGRFEDEGWRVRKDGSRFWANVVITALHDDSGHLRGFAKVTRDLTERKRMESLETSNRQMTEFVAMLAHELRNPLAPILMASSAAQLGTSDPERTARALTIIERQARHLGRLVDDLLDVSRISRGDVRLELRRMRLADAVAQGIEAVRPIADQKQHTLTVELKHDPVVRGDPVRLTQVVSNLVGNSAKYTPPDGRIDIAVDVRENDAVLTVADNGIGIDPEVLPRVFDSFTQDRRALDRGPGGLGLGLTIARRIVDLHGGTIVVESAGPGCGTRVEVTLPMQSTAAEAGLTVLVVDDNVDAAQILREVVEMGGHRAVMAFDGETALALARAEKPDIALLDLGLPGLSGYELARAFRGEPELKGMQIVAISGYATQADRELSAESGFDAHLAKPLALDMLFKTLPALKPR
ncbi:ATP-binding response regulator [Arenimonas composti]|uniref:histidine kinase n=2 Tax=Arenimonas TaxID=490567 RepID=A0A091BF55_9GAMM|nr:hypothetical protein P873_08030 [Arenimonas composti TR7-09 = DSM 18010]